MRRKSPKTEYWVWQRFLGSSNRKSSKAGRGANANPKAAKRALGTEVAEGTGLRNEVGLSSASCGDMWKGTRSHSMSWQAESLRQSPEASSLHRSKDTYRLVSSQKALPGRNQEMGTTHGDQQLKTLRATWLRMGVALGKQHCKLAALTKDTRPGRFCFSTLSPPQGWRPHKWFHWFMGLDSHSSNTRSPRGLIN